jgi:hypothetical protein
MAFVNTVDVIGDDALTDSIIDRSITTYNDDSLINIGAYALSNCSNLTSANFPSVTALSMNVFLRCSNLRCVDLASVLVTFGNGVFSNCTNLEALILRGNRVSAVNYSSLGGSAIEAGTGYIYVPRDLVESYKTASYWSTYANQFRALEDYTVDGTTTGELDPTKI